MRLWQLTRDGALYVRLARTAFYKLLASSSSHL